MWLWQRKNIRNRLLLWAKLSGTSLIFHIIFLGWLFFMYKDSTDLITIIAQKNAHTLPILFVPHNHINQVRDQAKNTATTYNDKRSVVTTQSNVTHKTTHKKKSSVVQTQLTPQKKQTVQTETIHTQKGHQEKKQEQSTPHVEKKSATTQKNKGKKQLQAATQPEQRVEKVEPSNAIVSDNYREVEELRRSSQLQKELVAHWRPPIGTLPSCSCEISFTVNHDGKIGEIKMIKSSGVTMYDISARQAILSIIMPHWTQGKTITIQFTQ